jgi:GTP-binding protein YchF
LKIGIIGLASSGKTTLFNALTGGAASTGGYGASQVNVGVGRVADPRVDAMSEMFHPKKTTYATVEFIDVPGLGEERDGGSSEAAENIPAALQGADALLLVLRAFDDPGVPHPRQNVDAARDLSDMRLDLVLRDLDVIERRVERLKKSLAKKKDPTEAAEYEVLEKIQTSLGEGVSILAQNLSEKDLALLRGYGFLSAKPVLAVLNVGEDQIGESTGALGVEVAEGEAPPVVVGAQLEEELAQLDDDEQAVFLADYGLDRPARDRVIQASFALLGLECFLTVGEDEVRAWPIRRGTSALKAAGSIHSDLERGFIRAEVISYDDFVAAGSMAAARDKGVLRIEGKDYEVKDGEILHVRFNV